MNESVVRGIANETNMTAFWDLFTPTFDCPYHVEKIGAWKWICGLSEIAKLSKCVVYSFGIDNEFLFDEAILERTKCKVHMYEKNQNFPIPVQFMNRYPGRATYTKLGIGNTNTELNRTRTLRTLMKKNGDTFIDILKVDVEGAEWAALEKAVFDFPNWTLPIGQLQVELHSWGTPTTEWYTMYRSLFLNLEKSGLRLFSLEVNPLAPICAEFAFLNIKYKLFKIVDGSSANSTRDDWEWSSKYYKNTSQWIIEPRRKLKQKL